MALSDVSVRDLVKVMRGVAMVARHAAGGLNTLHPFPATSPSNELSAEDLRGKEGQNLGREGEGERAVGDVASKKAKAVARMGEAAESAGGFRSVQRTKTRHAAEGEKTSRATSAQASTSTSHSKGQRRRATQRETEQSRINGPSPNTKTDPLVPTQLRLQ